MSLASIADSGTRPHAAGAPAGLKPLPPKPAASSPAKPTKDELTEELNAMVSKMNTQQLSRLMDEARKIAK